MKYRHSLLLRWVAALALSALCLGPAVMAQTSNADANNSPALTLNPAVIMVKAKPGQTFSQELTLWNNTIYELRFHMEAQDVVVRDGRRVFVPAGELQGSIARNAVFTEEDLIALPGRSITTRVTVTLPPTPGPRAIACIFMGRSPIATRNALSMTASLGALVTFTVDSDFHLQNDPLQVEVDEDAKTITFREQVRNTGRDPVVPQGVIAVTSEGGALIARVPVEGHRLLPGESSEFTAEHPGLPKAGKYKVTLLMQNESALFSNAAEFSIK